MAKTVFGKELHLRLRRRLAFIPWDELVEQLKQDAPLKTWKLKDTPRITEFLGPVKGFRLKYTLQQSREMTSVPGGMALQMRVELDRFVLIPIADDLGEPLDAALAGPSQFRTILEADDPNRTTITVWVYPDSFNDFRRLKAELFRLGYSTAGRPMPEGLPIGGSPGGPHCRRVASERQQALPDEHVAKASICSQTLRSSSSRRYLGAALCVFLPRGCRYPAEARAGHCQAS